LFTGATNPKVIDAEGKKWFQMPMNTITQNAFEEGHDAVVYRNIVDNMYGSSFPSDVMVMKNTQDIRSVNAAFDPAQRGSRNLMAGAAGATIGLSALRNIQRDEEPQPD
jgi:hypothetical protein